MTDSLQAAAALADKLGHDFEAALPDTEPVIDCDELAADRMELRQVAGISAGGCLELRPGNYDFGPVSRGPGRLEDGQPESVGFTLRLDDDLVAVVGPGSGPLSLDDEPVVEPTDLDGRVINAGSARFVVARPRPPRRRGGSVRDVQLTGIDPWVVAPIPGRTAEGSDFVALIDQRRRLHYGPDDIRHRIEGGVGQVWDRDPSHPMFGTAVVAMADVPFQCDDFEVAAAVPVSLNLVGSTTVIVGERRLQLAVARHILLALAAATHPDDLRLVARSDAPDLDFVRRLPHGAGVDDVGDRSDDGAHRLFIVDRSTEPAPARVADDGRTGGSSLLILADPDGGSGHGRDGRDDLIDLDDEVADVITLSDEATISIAAADGIRIDDATPVGFARSMALDLVGKLRLLYGLDTTDD